MSGSFVRHMSNDAPLSVTHDPGKWNILGLLACLIVCLAFAIPFAVTMAADQGKPALGEDPSEDIILLAGFSVGTLFFAGWTVLEVMRRRKKKRVYRVEGNDIACFDGNGILWHEPKSAYRQLRWQEETRSYVNKYGRQFYTVQALTLEHAQADRCFEILAHQDSAHVQASCERWAKALDLPIMRAEAGQPLERSADELAKPLVTLASEDRLSSNFDIDALPPAGTTWGRDGNVLWARARPLLFPAVVMVPLIVIAGLGTAVEDGEIDQEGIPALIVFLALALVLVLVTAVFRQVVRVSPSEVIGEYGCLGVTLWRRRLPLASIVRVFRMDWPLSDGVIVEGLDQRIYLVPLNRKVAHWLIGFIQNAVLKQGSAADR